MPSTIDLRVLCLVSSVLVGFGCRSAAPVTVEEMARIHRPSLASLSPDGRRLAFVVGDSLLVQLTDGVATPILGGLTGEVSAPIPWIAWSPDGTRLAVRAASSGSTETGSGPGVPLVVDVASGSVSQLLTDVDAGAISTFRSFLTGPPAWSPDGTRLAFVGWEPEGENPSATSVYVVDLDTGVRRRIDVGPTEAYNVTWSPDGSWLIYTRGAFRGADGAVVLHRAGDLSAPPVEYRAGASLYRAPLWFPDGERLMVRDLRGAPTVLRIPADGTPEELPTVLPPRRYAAFVDDGTALIATVSDGMWSRLVRVEVRTGAETELLGGDRLYDAIGVARDASRDRIVFNLESGDLPPEIWAAPLHADGSLEPAVPVTTVNGWLDPNRLARSEVYRWRTADGADLDAQLLLPRDADAGPLPLVVLPYGGYRDEFPGSSYFLNQAIHPLAASGYAVVRPNTRGYASEQVPDGRYGAVQLEDTRDLIASLARDGIVDAERVVLLGHSHGGAMVFYYLTHSDLFAGGVAVNGAADWVYQAGLQTMVGLPRGMGGSPEELPERYEAFSPLARYRHLTVPLLAVTGSLDTQIPESQSGAIVDSLRSAGQDARWMSFADEGHLIAEPRNRREFWRATLAFIARVTEGPEVLP